MERTTAVLAGVMGLERTRGIGRKLFVGVLAPLVAVLLAAPANADIDDDFVDMLNQNGISIGKGAAVEMAETACNSPLAGTGYANALQEMQQRYPKYDINTVARVMAAGILAYCPQRLS